MSRLASSVLMVVCLGAPVWAQTTGGGSVRGVVTDAQGAVLPGVTITATSATAAEPSTAVSDDGGAYRLVGLPPGTFRVEAALAGFTTLVREPIVVRAGLNVQLDLALEVGTIEDRVEVVGETPLLERTLPSQAVNIDGELQRSLPLSPRRHWTDFLLLTPGVTSSNLGSQRMTYFTHGSGFDSQVTLIDGAEVDPAGQNYSGTVNLSTEALADVQVTTLGVPASAPLGAGAVVNAVTRSGTNTFTGSATVTWQHLGWSSSNVPDGTSARSAIFQPEVGVGGPLKRDRAWFFASYRRNDYTEGIDRTRGQLEHLRALDPGFEPFDRRNISNYYFGKLSARVSDRHRVQGFYKYDIDPLDSAASTSGGIYAHSISGGHAGTVQLHSIVGSHLTTRFSTSLNDSATSTDAARDDLPRRRVFASTTPISGRRRGVGLLAELDNAVNLSDRDDRRLVVSADATLAGLPRIEAHELQFGVYWQALDLLTTTRYVNGGFSSEEAVLRDAANPAAGATAFHRQIFDDDYAVTQDATSRDLAVYVQDTWRLAPTATIMAGVRVDRIRHVDHLFGLRTQESTDVGPRFGVNIGVPGDDRAAFHGSWARRHEGTATTVVSTGTNSLGFRDEYDIDLDGRFDTTFVTPGTTVRFPDRQFDPDRHQPYVDDVTAGYRRQMDGATTIDATYVHRTFRDRVAAVEVNGIYTDGVFGGYRNPAVNEIYLITNNRWNRQVYDAVELRIARSTASVQALASYTRQWRHLAGTWQPNDPASFVQPDAFANDKGIGQPRGFAAASEANALSGTTMAHYMGLTSQWCDHVVNLGLSVRAPWDLLLATTYTYSSGPWSGPVVTRLAAPAPAFGPPVVPLSNGRAVSNPLATTLRFPGQDRSEGQFTLPSFQTWNLRFGRAFAVGGARLELSVNVLNLLNGDADLILNPGGNQLFSPLYKTFFNRQAPRSGQLFVRVLF